ncbi:MAG: hypothetical protein IMW95_02685 [Moorella humiferrea]|nr:hypothetical protein [Moorella humiferrea]
MRSITRKEIDHLPIQIEFTPAALDKVTKAWGVPNKEYLIERLDNHLVYAYLNDPFGKIRKRIFTPEEKILYDEWGVGWEVRHEVKRCIEVLGAYGSYIIAPSNQISSEVPMANIEALIQAVEDYKAGKL